MSRLILEEKFEDFVTESYQILIKFPQSEKFALSQEIKNIMYKTLNDILSFQYSKNSKLLYIKLVDKNIRLLGILFKIAFSQRYISPRCYDNIKDKLKELGRITGGIIKKMNY